MSSSSAVRTVFAFVLAAGLAGCITTPDVLTLSAPTTIAAPSLRPFADGINWVVERDVVFRYQSWPEIRVPRGFVTDLASVPALLRSLRSREGTYSRAAIVHDYLYATARCSRAQADAIFYRAMVTSGTAPKVAMQLYEAVSKFGGVAFKHAQEELAAGLPRVVPADRFELADNGGWKTLRETLPKVAPQTTTVPAGYCALGDVKPERPKRAGNRASPSTPSAGG